MHSRRTVLTIFVIAALSAATAARHARAHFPWLATDAEGRALLFFSESPAERNYHTPECVEEAKVVALTAKGQESPVELESLHEDGFVGRRSTAPVPGDALLTTKCEYGVYHGTLLKYYVKHAPSVTALSEPSSKSLKLDAQVKPTDGGLEVRALWDGKPLAGASVTLVGAEGDPARATSDDGGVAVFETAPDGLVGAIVGNTVAGVSGEADGEEYGSESHYLTVTWNNTKAPKAASALPPLPEAVASFGAAVADGWLYVYSGHIGTAHDHSRDNLSKHFRRVRLDSASEWEELPMQTPLQGLPLVAHGGKLYRVGGLSARNASGEEEDLHSTDEVACFDPATSQWTTLPSLPAPRSSHDAVVISDELYVVGGWRLSGSDDGEWHDTLCVLDLTSPGSGWQELSGPPVKRRALAAAHADGALVVLGGMQEDHGVTQRVDAFDPSTGEWTQLADFPGERVHGFGVSAWTRDSDLYASGNEGVVYELDREGDSWRPVATLDTPRFFHRLLPGPEGALLAVAGASFEHGHLAGVERVALK